MLRRIEKEDEKIMWIYVRIDRDSYKNEAWRTSKEGDFPWIREHVPALPTVHRFIEGESKARLVEGACCDEKALRTLVRG